MKKLIIISLILFIGCKLSIILITHHKEQNKNNENINEPKKLKESKYTPEEMLAFFRENKIPEDKEVYFDIICHWYDYFPKDTLFINKNDEIYSYDEYMKIRKNYDDDYFKFIMPFFNKNTFLPILSPGT